MTVKTMRGLPLNVTHEKKGDAWVMKEEYAVPYRESVAAQTKSWLEGKPVHNTFADECCPDFSCCNVGSLWPEETRKAFVNGSEALRYQLMSQSMAKLASDNAVGDVYISGSAVPETKH